MAPNSPVVDRVVSDAFAYALLPIAGVIVTAGGRPGIGPTLTLAILGMAACKFSDLTSQRDAAIDTMDSAIAVDSPDGGEAATNPLVGIGTVELVQGGYQFVEGPQWREAQGDLLFSDLPSNTIYRYTPGGGAPIVHRTPSGNSNGLAIDGSGAVIAAQHGTRSVTRDGVDIAATFNGESLNSPNDVVVADNGTMYFTDPPYGLPGGANSSDLGFMGVFRISGTTLTAEYMGALSERPNGIALSPNATHLYVADTSDGNVYTFTVMANGALGPRNLFTEDADSADGLAVDAAGNVFVASTTGIRVFATDGTAWGTITTPMQPANCAFGDADHRTLYITARTGLYRVRLANAGLPRR